MKKRSRTGSTTRRRGRIPIPMLRSSRGGLSPSPLTRTWLRPSLPAAIGRDPASPLNALSSMTTRTDLQGFDQKLRELTDEAFSSPIPMRRLATWVQDLSALALQSDYSGQVRARVGKVGLDAQGLLKVFGRLGRLALLTEHRAPVVVGFGKVGPETQGLLEVFDRLGRLTLGKERLA